MHGLLSDCSHFLLIVFLEIVKLLCTATFLNTAARGYYLYVGLVLRNKANRIRNQIVIECTSQNFILPIMSPIVTFRSSPWNHKWTICGWMVMTVMTWEVIRKQLLENPAFFLALLKHKYYTVAWKSSNIPFQSFPSDCHLPIITIKPQMNYLWCNGDNCGRMNMWCRLQATVQCVQGK
jgi:hypothetical protein